MSSLHSSLECLLFIHATVTVTSLHSFLFSSLQGFASLIIELTGSNSTIRNLPRTEDDPKQRKPDISLAEREIGWKPMVSHVMSFRFCIACLQDSVKAARCTLT